MSFLDLNWLAKSDKDILLPHIVFIEMPVSGECIIPQKKELLIGDKYYPLDRGVFKINPDHNDSIPAILAHEWRHLWQFYKGWKYDGKGWNLKSRLTYEKQICQFFLNSRCEYDALLFGLAKYPGETEQEWFEWIIQHKELNHVLA